MLSAMTTSENFSLRSQSRCSGSPYRTRSAFGGSRGFRDECREFLLESSYSGYEPEPIRPRESGEEFEVAAAVVTARAADDVGLETDINELLEELDLEDVAYDQSKPLKIEPNLLELSLFPPAPSADGEFRSLDEFCAKIARENKRASHHLSGGGLLSGSSQDLFQNLPEPESKSRSCTLSDAGCISTENVFDFDAGCFDARQEDCRASNFLNQISPSSPLTFDLAADAELKTVTKGTLTDVESTNPFTDYLKDVPAESTFSPTNPFYPSSLPNSSADYENVSVPEKSFSRCSTRPASPARAEEPRVSNPFLPSQTSPRTLNLTHFFLGDGRHYPQPTQPSSFVFAVPVFPIFQHRIANSSTQTSDPPETGPPPEPVYQNVTNQLKKFMQRNNHSEYDLQCLKTTMKDLRNSGWYYENVSWQESVVLLKNTEPGTFLIRDSSDPNFLFSLSVQTSRGPTSVRLHYVNGQFRLDAEEKLIPHMPSFGSVIELIDYYIENTVKNKFAGSNSKKSAKKSGKDRLQKSKEQVWIDSQGNVYSNILLVKPLYKKEHFSTLQHLTRLAINRHVRKNAQSRSGGLDFRVTAVYESSPFQDSSFPVAFDGFGPISDVDDLPLPVTLINYLKDYPYCH
ncbi:UNVERIFIED_CONTAM: hypothetical protein PYX00_001179 [Menopon gallinae]|uniref:Uncharacterized protein n=1 Tax=Menopon gallinae TaxID=328185 RepID=A0AAW2IBS0_9NEOP